MKVKFVLGGSQSVEGLKKWKRGGGSVSEFYTIAEDDEEEFKCYVKSDLGSTPQELASRIEQISKLRALNSGYPMSAMSDDLIGFFEPKVHNDLVELPPGIYNHSSGRYPEPEKLSVMSVRDDIYFETGDVMKRIAEDISVFIESREIYRNLPTLHKRGYIFYGPPGGGKTAFIRHLVSKVFPKDSYVIWLSGVPSDVMLDALTDLPSLKVFVIEEMTSHSDNPSAVKAFLEFLDGEKSIDNAIVIGTTNYPEELKKNLADRPSRFDVVEEIKEPGKEEAKFLFERFLKRPLLDGEVPLEKLSVAHIKEICLKHLTRKIPLKEAYEQAITSRTKYKKGFSESKTMGFVPE